ncbi:hypothetical protein SPW_7334 [Streptomyces sp. W007]|uniref:hypothetical protein n=1 Tax=Streptomyces sp. W007 TaxID=1055352 RepID=UPI000241A775|nr:hypothetical protein [Streptomyces sp. W007]EHM24240.1 hypothetical protein SPW_7334 [Streptomyces sp. W007]
MITYGPAPIDLLHDSPAVRDHKAGAGWLWYALRNAGMTDEQIANSLTTYDASVKRLAFETAADLLDAQELEGAALVRYLSMPHTDDVGATR